ncbi:MAG TPA: MFS transporter [Candidatus Elarobacter sp.]|jgi:MFS family permease|nr:MFS transporter [Candidatus Elarobacter sp.]
MSGRAAFRLLWAGQTASMFGTAVSRLAIPTIAILSLGAAPFAVGALEAVEFAAFPLLGLVAGVMVDRWSRRTTMLVADVVRAAALASIPLAAAAHALGYGQLLAVAACSGAASVFFAIAYQSIVPSLVEADALERANARLEFTNSAAQIAGNGLGGWLIAVLGAPLTVVLDAASYVVSVVTLLAMRVRETHRESRAEPVAFVPALREGFAVVFGSPVLVRIITATAFSNLGGSIVNAVYLIYAYRVLHLSPALVGLVFALANVGFAGAFFAPRIAERFGAGPTLLGAATISSLAPFALPLAAKTAQPLVVLFAVDIAITLSVPVYNITQISLRHRLVAPERHGRMNATVRTIVWGVFPLGALIGGALGGSIGIVPTVLVGACAGALALVPLLTRPVRELTRP